MVVGIGLEPVSIAGVTRAPLDALGIPQNYLLYLGRVDRNKGCDALLENFQEYASTRPMSRWCLPARQRCRSRAAPGFARSGTSPNEVREALLAHAHALVVPSWYESLSIVLLEAWNHGIPALVNGRCKVLAGQVRRANGGLYYMFPAEFDEAADFLLNRPTERDAHGPSGTRVHRSRVPVAYRVVAGGDAASGGSSTISSTASKCPFLSRYARMSSGRELSTGPAMTYRNSSNACSRSVGDGSAALRGCE